MFLPHPKNNVKVLCLLQLTSWKESFFLLVTHIENAPSRAIKCAASYFMYKCFISILQLWLPQSHLAVLKWGYSEIKRDQIYADNSLCNNYYYYYSIACIFQGTDLHPQLQNLLFSVWYNILGSIFHNIILLIIPCFFSCFFLILTHLEYRKR